MRLIAFIMAMSIFTSAVKASPVVQFVKSHMFMSDCHSHDTANEDSCHYGDNEDDDSSCCGDMGCECTCCVHLMIMASLVDIDFANEVFADVTYGFAWSYTSDYQSTTFHPPAIG